MRKLKLANFFVALVAVVILVVVGLFLPRLIDQVYDKQPSAQKNVEQTIDIEIDSGTEVLNFNDIEIQAGETLFTVLRRVTDQHSIEFSYQDFGGEMGMFIESINNSVESLQPDAWWQYWINGEYAQIGVSNYYVKNGDQVKFKFTADQFE